MIQVNEILKLTLFHNFKIICGEKFLNNTVNAAVILEYESSRINYNGYGYGYFVLASYFFAKTNPELVNNSLKTLIKKHVSGIAIKIPADEKVPDDIIELAIDNHVPLLTFYQEFMEDLILNINESMKTRAQYIINEEKLHSILSGTLDAAAVRKTALEINSNFKQNAIVVTMSSKENADNLKIHTYFDNLMYRQFHTTESAPYTFVKFGLDLILICTFDEAELKTLVLNKYVKDTLVASGFTPSSFYIGMCDSPEPLESLTVSLVKAQDANVICKFKNVDSMTYDKIGTEKYIMPYIRSKPFHDDVLKKIQILTSYDAIHESNLLKTLIHHVNDNGDFSETSKECFQHINTIRYRIKKAEQLLSLEEATADEELVLLIRCYLLSQMTDKPQNS